MFRTLLAAALAVTALAQAADIDDAPVATYTCTFQEVKNGAAGPIQQATLVVASGCTVTDELTIGGYSAMAQGCVSTEKNDLELFVYPSAGFPQATSSVKEWVANAETSFLVSAKDKYTMSCVRK